MKLRIDDLGIFGGQPAFKEKLHVGTPNIGDRNRLLERINNILDNRWLTNNGMYVLEFEQRLAELIGVKHCIATCSATVALQIVIKAADLAGEVVIPSFTFVATAHSLQWLGITPVFCDVDPSTHNIDPRRIEQNITSLTTGIIGVHLWGRPCPVEDLTDIARRHNLKLFFDAAHALGCSHKGKMVGNFGDAEVFSFHATKLCNSFEGGMIATNDDALAARARLMRNFGFKDYDEVIEVGTNGKMNETAAAMGLTSLESMEEFISINAGNHRQYQAELRDIPGVRVVIPDDSEKHNYHYVVLEIDEALSTLSRDQLQRVLWQENVLARRYFYPGCHRMEPYHAEFSRYADRLQHTERLARSILALPTGTAVSAQQISGICQITRFALANGTELASRLSAR